VLAVLHSWTQKLDFHPHVHCLVTGGGLPMDGRNWHHARRSFLFPTRALAKLALQYLARYVFRIAITNRRIVAVDQDSVTFRYKDRAAGKHRLCTLPGHAFMRRYLQHVMPKGFHKVQLLRALASGQAERAPASRPCPAAAAPPPPPSSPKKSPSSRPTGLPRGRCSILSLAAFKPSGGAVRLFASWRGS
jgi:hypothetical protein